MMEMGPNNANTIQRVCIRCGDSNVLTRERCAGCAFDLTSDLQRDYDLYRHGVPLDAPSGTGEPAGASRNTAARPSHSRSNTEPGGSGAGWIPYRHIHGGEPTAALHGSGHDEAKATLDLGAAVLEAIFDGTEAPRQTLDIGGIAPFLIDGVEPFGMPDPVACSFRSPARVERPVIVGDSSATISADAAQLASPGPAPVVGAVHTWVGISTEGATPDSAPGLERRNPPLSEVPTRPRMTLPPPPSRRKHIRVGASTYLDDMQRGVRRPTGSWLADNLSITLVVTSALLIAFAYLVT